MLSSCWSANAPRLFGYACNNAVVSYQEIGAVSTGKQHTCSVKTGGSSYGFSVDGKSIAMPREVRAIRLPAISCILISAGRKPLLMIGLPDKGSIKN